MQRPLSNVSYHSYQEYQPTRRYGPQHEPGGYAAAVQQRTNMTQREDALKFEQGRIKALQEERLHIQKKTFTKWMNSFLQKARMEVEDLFVDLADGRRLLKLLEIISGERLPRPNSGRMRVHKIENVNKSLSFLHTKVRLESIGAEDIVDGNPRLILGLIWTIILRFQIQEIEIDVDEENESSEKKSAKDALLLWCQRKTSGYHGVHIHNFTDSWRSGLGFNALIHSHRPDLFRWNDLPTTDHVETLNHAFDVAHSNLGIPKLLDAEDVDTTRPDEKSVMTYVASYYHTFARMKNEQKSGRRIANIIGQLMDMDARKAEYQRLMSALLAWIQQKILQLSDRELPNSLDAIQRLLLAFKQYRTVEKPPKYKERSDIEALFFDVNTQHKSLLGDAWSPEGQLPQDIERAWQRLEQAEHAREIALRTELLRQQRLEQLNYKFNTKSVLRKGYLKEMIQVLSDPRYGSNLAQVDATVKKHEAISADILARKERFEDLSAMAAELVREKYHGAEAVSAVSDQVLQRWAALLQLLERHRTALSELAHLMALLRESDARLNTVRDMKSQFQSEEAGRHLSDVERLLQAHALQELQLGALDDAIRKLVRQGNAVEGPAQPKQQLTQQLTHLEDEYDSLVAAAKDRKARLEDARNLYQFLEDHDEEEGWVIEKQRICRADVAAKDLRGVQALRVKHTALLHELRARDHVAERHRHKGQSLIDAQHPKSGEISRRLASLDAAWRELRELAAKRDSALAEAHELYQFYAEADAAEQWVKEKTGLVANSDCGEDAPAAAALAARHRATHEQILAYKPELTQLTALADKLTAQGIHTLQLPRELDGDASGSGAGGEEDQSEWVHESRLVPTSVWEEQPVERLEHRSLTEERSVPQVKALYAFTGQGISMAKGEVMFLISKTNPDWWSVRKADRTDGFVPANYVREIEPRIVPVQVRRAEKVRTVQRVQKTVLVKQVVPVRRAAAPRALRRAVSTAGGTGAQAAQTVGQRDKGIQDSYEELVKMSLERRVQLEDAIQLFRLFAECDDLERWCRDKERLLLADEPARAVHSAKRNYEKLVTDLSGASKRLAHIESACAALAAARHGQAARAQARRAAVRRTWDRLHRLQQERERTLEGASSVELFGRTCDEALDWMREKEAQLEASEAAAGGAGGADLRSVRALQRRHAQLERELEPLQDKIRTVALLADDVKSQYPTERENVESRQEEIQEMWSRCQQSAAARRSRLEGAVGCQLFQHGTQQLLDLLAKSREQLSQETVAKDLATAEALRKEHHDLKEDFNTHADEFEEVIGLGKQLVSNNPSLVEVAAKVKQLEEEKAAFEQEWSAKEARLQRGVRLASFARDADRIDAATSAHQACLETTDTGSSLDEVGALLKRHEELETRLVAQEERVQALRAKAAAPPAPADDTIVSRCKSVVERREAVRAAAAERRRALQASLAHHQFMAEAEELQAWIQDKTKTAKDQSYRDLSNLERKLQKHEAFERELQANEKQLRNLESAGAALQSSSAGAAGAAVGAAVTRLGGAWAALTAAARDKGRRLRQARAQRAHARDVEAARARLAEIERALASTETGADLRTCKRLLAQHQTVEQELQSLSQKATALSAAGEDLVSSGHFDAPAIQKHSQALLEATAAAREPAKLRTERLQTTLRFHKFASEVSAELDWLSERDAAIRATGASSGAGAGVGAGAGSGAGAGGSGAALLAATSHVKRLAKLREELAAHRPVLEKLTKRADELLEQEHPDADKIAELSASVETRYAEVCDAAAARHQTVERARRACQFLHEAGEVDAWLAERAQTLAAAHLGQDRHRAAALLTTHKALELELDTYAAIIAEMGRAAREGTSGPGGAGAGSTELVERHARLADSLARLQALAAARRHALVGSICRHEYLAESEELEEWIREQHAAASSDDYGHDYEHLLVLQSKFSELRHRVESGAERFTQCEELAKKLLAGDSPHIELIESRQELLGEHWQRLVDQMSSRGSRLHAAGDIHRFHRDVAELVTRAAERRAALAAAPTSARLDPLDTDLLAIDAQVQVLQEEGARLIKLYPGGNVQQIEMQQKALEEAWSSLRQAADQRKEDVRRATQLHQFITQARDLSSWCVSARAQAAGGARARDAAAAQAHRADHDALKSEIEARDDTFRQVLQMAEDMIQSGHPAAQEIEERSSQLVAERGRLAAAWAARQVALDQLIDLRCFLRDAAQLNDLCAAQEPMLNSEISPTLSVEEVQNLLKKHEAFEKLLVTQDEKLATLNSHGDKLLQQSHVESERIAGELQALNQRRKKIHSLVSSRRGRLSAALAAAQFSREAADTRAWLAGKLHALRSDRGQGETTDLEDKMKQLQKHQAFSAEVAANQARIQEVEALAEQLRRHGDASAAAPVLEDLKRDWQHLLDATEQRGRGLEEAQDILEFNQQLDKIEAWIRDKEMMVNAAELGRDYEHCSALLRKLDDLDSDMQVDDRRVRAVCQLADKLLHQSSESAAATTAARRDAFLARWRALSGALVHYRDRLTHALRLHAFYRDVEETSERIAHKAVEFASRERGRGLDAARELRRRHEERASAAAAVHARILDLTAEGRTLQESNPERATEIEASLTKLAEDWKKLEQLAAQRSALLDEALAEHKFDEELKELEAWTSETVRRMETEEPARSVEAAEAALRLHQERKAEIDGRETSIAALEASTADAGRKQRLRESSAKLRAAWAERERVLIQVHQLQQFESRARDAEEWLASKEAVLNNDDLGENLDAVENLIRAHEEFSKLVETQRGKLDELRHQAAALLDDDHKDSEYIQQRVAELTNRGDKLKESCGQRGKMLEQSKQLHVFVRELTHRREWIALKAQLANDQNYRELSNLQSKLQRHAALESELAANKQRVDDLAAHGEALIEGKHYASEEIAHYIEELENEWTELQSAARARRARLGEAGTARVLQRAIDDFTAWLAETDSQLLNDDLGKELGATLALRKRHARLTRTVRDHADGATQLVENARHLAESGHFMAQELLERATAALDRYKQLAEPLQIREDNLRDAEQFYRWDRDRADETRWLTERYPEMSSKQLAPSLAAAQQLLKKHHALEAEIAAREPTVTALCHRAEEMSRRGHYAAPTLESSSAALRALWAGLGAAAAARLPRLTTCVATHQLLEEVSEHLALVESRRAALAAPAAAAAAARDEESARALRTRLLAVRASLAPLDAALPRLRKGLAALPEPQDEESQAERDRLAEGVKRLADLYDEVKLLSAQRDQRLDQALKYYKFVEECSETQEWITEQVSTAASEEYGLDVEHVETLQQTFDNFLAQLHANEGRIEAVVEAGNVLLEENSPESERVKQRIEDIRGLWDDLRELAIARQEALAGAREVHEFDRSAEETVSWIREKEALVPAGTSGAGGASGATGVSGASGDSGTGAAGPSVAERTSEADLNAIRAQHEELVAQADKLSAAYPDAAEHVSCKLEEVTEALAALSARVATAQHQLHLAAQLHAYFRTCQELLAWCNATLALVTAPELAREVPAAERLVARHRDLRAEILAREDAFTTLYTDGEKLVSEGHFMSEEISERMSTLRTRWQLLAETWQRRADLYAQHLDALCFNRDADALDNWISTREGAVRDGRLGDTPAQTEELLAQHSRLEETIRAHEARFLALKRITLLEQSFRSQQEAEAASRLAAAERERRDRDLRARTAAVQQVADQRRREREEQQESREEPASPAPQFDKLPKPEPGSGVKRAESMQVSTTKGPKRTPSFTTRRRTQSFRRQRDPDLPPLEIQGTLERKQSLGSGGARASVRSWRSFHTVLCGQLLCFFRDQLAFANHKAAAPPQALAHAHCAPAPEYRKRAHVFRLSCADGAEFLFAAPTRDLMAEWVAKIAFHAALPPHSQLTPYGGTPGDTAAAVPASPHADIKRRLRQNSSSSSSEASPSPVSARAQPDLPPQRRVIESSVLPSLPPRQALLEDEERADVVMRDSEQPAWGRSRFSNGRDINADFIHSQREAGAPPLPASGPPAPVLPERGPKIPERNPTIPERSSNTPDRNANIPERNSVSSDRSSTVSERTASAPEKPSVTALVNRYQQQQANWSNNNPGSRGSWNNNWQNAETTSHFYTASELAYGGGNARPASIAGSGGGSPALDHRPASRSSGESEVSVSGQPRDKKDKKGVFGGLFSRKKRPQSHT